MRRADDFTFKILVILLMIALLLAIISAVMALTVEAAGLEVESTTKYCGCNPYWINGRYQMLCMRRTGDSWWLFHHYWWRGTYWGTAVKTWVAAPRYGVDVGYGWSANVYSSACPRVWRGE